MSVLSAITGFANRSQAISIIRRHTLGGIGTPWRGTVTRVSGSTVYVEIPLYARGHEFACEDYSGAGATVTVGISSGTVRPIAAGDSVVVEFWGSDDPVIVSRRV